MAAFSGENMGQGNEGSLPGVRRQMLLLMLIAGLVALPAQSAVPVIPDRSDDAIDEVIVVLEADRGPAAVRLANSLSERYDMSVGVQYTHVFNGFAASISSSQTAALRSDPAVARVYPDGEATINRHGSPPGVRRVQADLYNHVPSQDVVVDGDIAILDTGVNQHPDLNVHRSVDCARDAGCTTRGPADDVFDHGTSVAGVAAALDDHHGVVGVAPGARIWNVRVFDPNGYVRYSWVVAALDWLLARGQVEVANMSFGGKSSELLKRAISGATRRGLVVVASAGNARQPAGVGSPANAPDAITVSAFVDTDGSPGGYGRRCPREGRDDWFWRYSNYGRRVVDIAAPGACVRTTADDGRYTRVSGTSFAAPHVAGAALLWVNKERLQPTPDRAALVRAGLRGEWGKPQTKPCGFQGGKSNEPVLVIGRCRH